MLIDIDIKVLCGRPSYRCSPMGLRLCSGEAVISYKSLSKGPPVLADVTAVERVALPGFCHTVLLHMETWALRCVVFGRVLNLVAWCPGTGFIQMVKKCFGGFPFPSDARTCCDQEKKWVLSGCVAWGFSRILLSLLLSISVV